MISLHPLASKLAATVLVVALAACAGEDGGEEPPAATEFTVSVGTWDPDGTTFYELTDGQPVDVVLGFQGLVFVNLALLADREIPARFTAEGEIVFEDYDERYPFYDNQVLFEPLDDEWRLVPSFRVPFNLDASELIGRTVRLDVTLSSHTDEWIGHASRSFTLVDSGCVHTPEGEFVCED